MDILDDSTIKFDIDKINKDPEHFIGNISYEEFIKWYAPATYIDFDLDISINENNLQDKLKPRKCITERIKKRKERLQLDNVDTQSIFKFGDSNSSSFTK